MFWVAHKLVVLKYKPSYLLVAYIKISYSIHYCNHCFYTLAFIWVYSPGHMVFVADHHHAHIN